MKRSVSHPKVSVIIPCYNHGAFLADAVQSVLGQTFSDFEVIIVDDGSQDNTQDVALSFTDSRIKFIHQENKGLPGARNAGIRHAEADFIALLDADDKYLPRKLELQLAFLDQHPEVDLAYSSCYHVNEKGQKLAIRLAPREVDLSHLLLGFPFTCNDVIVRRKALDDVGGFDESFILNSEDLDLWLRLKLNSCDMAGLQLPLSERRFHHNRNFKDLRAKLEMMLIPIDTTLSDPRCPSEMLQLKDLAYTNCYLPWAFQGYVQGDVDVGKELLNMASKLSPTLLDKEGREFVRKLVYFVTRDGSDPERSIYQVFNNLPPELSWLETSCDYAIAQAYLLRAVQAFQWNNAHLGQKYSRQATKFDAKVDNIIIDYLVDQTIALQKAEGTLRASIFIRTALDHFEKERILSPLLSRKIIALLHLNQGFQFYSEGDSWMAIKKMVSAIRLDAQYVKNRGALTVLAKSIINPGRITTDKHPKAGEDTP